MPANPILNRIPAEVIADLDRLSRRRALKPHESVILERAIWQQSREPKRPVSWRWQADEDATALFLRRCRGLTPGQISFKLARSKNAIAARLRYLESKRAPCVGRRG